jgi:hypothetical protein
MPRTLYAHELVVKTAREMAEQLYEEVMSGSNEMYSGWKEQWPELDEAERQRRFVELLYPKLLEPARAILAHMLGDPQYAHLHESIYDSILKDKALQVGRAAPRGRPHLTLDEEGNVTKVTRTRN